MRYPVVPVVLVRAVPVRIGHHQVGALRRFTRERVVDAAMRLRQGPHGSSFGADYWRVEAWTSDGRVYWRAEPNQSCAESLARMAGELGRVREGWWNTLRTRPLLWWRC